MDNRISKVLEALNVVSIGSVEHEDGKVDIHYPGNEIDMKLDKRIERAMEKLGYSRYGSGYNLMENIRDIAFERV